VHHPQVLGFDPLHLGHANSAIARLSKSKRWRQGEALLAALRPAALQVVDLWEMERLRNASRCKQFDREHDG
jgi:hypothetical protein